MNKPPVIVTLFAVAGIIVSGVTLAAIWSQYDVNLSLKTAIVQMEMSLRKSISPAN